jgi:hypothetical protein
MGLIEVFKSTLDSLQIQGINDRISKLDLAQLGLVHYPGSRTIEDMEVNHGAYTETKIVESDSKAVPPYEAASISEIAPITQQDLDLLRIQKAVEDSYPKAA